jgi:hypothetical protein
MYILVTKRVSTKRHAIVVTLRPEATDIDCGERIEGEDPDALTLMNNPPIPRKGYGTA